MEETRQKFLKMEVSHEQLNKLIESLGKAEHLSLTHEPILNDDDEEEDYEYLEISMSYSNNPKCWESEEISA
jgi:hypothetical protein